MKLATGANALLKLLMLVVDKYNKKYSVTIIIILATSINSRFIQPL